MEDWEPVTLGRSGDGVWRSPDGAAYAKLEFYRLLDESF